MSRGRVRLMRPQPTRNLARLTSVHDFIKFHTSLKNATQFLNKPVVTTFREKCFNIKRVWALFISNRHVVYQSKVLETSRKVLPRVLNNSTFEI